MLLQNSLFKSHLQHRNSVYDYQQNTCGSENLSHVDISYPEHATQIVSSSSYALI